MSAKLVSIQVGRIQSFEEEASKPWESGIAKLPVAGPVAVGKLKLSGDEQFDLANHGGVDKAVLAYSADHFDAWANESDLEGASDWKPVPGAFGENLTIAGQVEEDVCVGDVYQIGSCQLEVSQPRQPCWKLSRRWRIPKLAARVQKTGRSGWYYRVVIEGEIKAGDEIQLVSRPFPQWTITKANAVMFAKPRNSADDLELANCPALSSALAGHLESRANDA